MSLSHPFQQSGQLQTHSSPCLFFFLSSSSHFLNDRKRKGEDIFDFCFYFLKFIEGDEFSLRETESLNVSPPEHSAKCPRRTNASSSSEPRATKRKEFDPYLNKGSWQMVSDLGSLGSDPIIPRRDSFNFGDEEGIPKVPSADALDFGFNHTPHSTLSECRCCSEDREGKFVFLCLFVLFLFC